MRATAAKMILWFWPVAVVILAATGGLLYLAIANASGTAKVWTALVTLAAGLSASAAGLRSGANRLAGGLEQTTWEAASTEAEALGGHLVADHPPEPPQSLPPPQEWRGPSADRGPPGASQSGQPARGPTGGLTARPGAGTSVRYWHDDRHPPARAHRRGRVHPGLRGHGAPGPAHRTAH